MSKWLELKNFPRFQEEKIYFSHHFVNKPSKYRYNFQFSVTRTFQRKDKFNREGKIRGFRNIFGVHITEIAINSFDFLRV